MPPWMRLASRVIHAVIYVLLLAIPLTAISGAWLEGRSLALLGNIRVGPLHSEAHAFGSAIASVHTWLGDAILWVAGLHAAAALYHHFVPRDGVLRSMLPG
jgi:cytochrome b561